MIQPSFHICLDYRMENYMKMSKFSSTESPILKIIHIKSYARRLSTILPHGQ